MSLEKYIGVKVIQAEPQDCQKDSHKSKVGDPGYKVIYEDGYISWSPKDVFEKAYRKTDGLTFGLAIEAMRKGLKVKFIKWSEGDFIYIKEDGHIWSSNHIWMPREIEILSDKWQIVD